MKPSGADPSPDTAPWREMGLAGERWNRDDIHPRSGDQDSRCRVRSL